MTSGSSMPALAGARAHPHPARGESRDRIGEAARPELLEGGGRAERDRAGELRLGGVARRPQLAEHDAAALVVARERFHRAMQIDRPLVSGRADQRDHALRLAERIGADEMRALGKQRDRMQELVDLVVPDRRWRNTGSPKVASVMNTSQGTSSNGAQVGSRTSL